jgi:hypothetical protein
MSFTGPRALVCRPNTASSRASANLWNRPRFRLSLTASRSTDLWRAALGALGGDNTCRRGPGELGADLGLPLSSSSDSSEMLWNASSSSSSSASSSSASGCSACSECSESGCSECSESLSSAIGSKQ